MQSRENVPTIFTIFGITGDLAQKKLIPALLDLFVKKELPERFHIIGFARRDFTHENIRVFLKEAIDKKRHTHSEESIQKFLETVHYHQGTFDDAACYDALSGEFKLVEEKWGQCSNKLLYLAVPPTYYENIITHLKTADLHKPCSDETGWTRILIEKPFGRDLDTAEKLEKLLGKTFKDEQIFRIDHYLAKEAVQNILAFRFSNALFEPLWNSEHIEEVFIRVHEDKDVSNRGAFYDSVGALRDVGQNHVLQLLALVAMEPPEKLSDETIQVARAKILKELSLSEGSLVRAQYIGFKESEGVAEDSQTETFFKLCTCIDTRRWKGVPFHLSGGKALNRSFAEIVIHFKAPEHMHFIPPQDRECRNTLTIRVQPDEGIRVSFWVKRPGFTKELEEQTLSFRYDESPMTSNLPDAYEQVLVDAIRGDHTLFTSTDEVAHAWKFITPILDTWTELPLISYEQGSDPEHITN